MIISGSRNQGKSPEREERKKKQETYRESEKCQGRRMHGRDSFCPRLVSKLDCRILRQAFSFVLGGIHLLWAQTECEVCGVLSGWLTDPKSSSWKPDDCALTPEVCKTGLLIPFPGGGPLVEGDGFPNPVPVLMRSHPLAVYGLVSDCSHTSLRDSLRHAPAEPCYPGICLGSIFRNLREWRSFLSRALGKLLVDTTAHLQPGLCKMLVDSGTAGEFVSEPAQNCICVFPKSLFCTSVSFRHARHIWRPSEPWGFFRPHPCKCKFTHRTSPNTPELDHPPPLIGVFSALETVYFVDVQ